MAADGRDAERHTLDPNLQYGERPQAVVPTDHWQRAVDARGWATMGCTVAPGFTFEWLELGPIDFDPNRPSASSKRT